MDPNGAENQTDDSELELALEEAYAAFRAYSELSDYQGVVDRFGKAVRLAAEAGRRDVLEGLSWHVRIRDATRGTVEMRFLPDSPLLEVVDLGFGPGDVGRGGRVREPRRPGPDSGSGSADVPT